MSLLGVVTLATALLPERAELQSVAAHRLRAGENITVHFSADAARMRRGEPLLMCFEGRSYVRAWLLWHRSVLRLSSREPATSFELSVASTDDIVALVCDRRSAALRATEQALRILADSDNSPVSSLRAGLQRASGLRPSAPLDAAIASSPFGETCVAITPSPTARPAQVLVTVDLEFVPFLPALLALGVTLFRVSDTWVKEDLLYYLTGSAFSVAFGMLLIVSFLLRRFLSSRWQRGAASAAAFAGYVGLAMDGVRFAASRAAARFWKWFVAYVAICAVVGLVSVHRAVRSSQGVPLWWRDVAKVSLIVLGGLLVINSSYSQLWVATVFGLCIAAALVFICIPPELRDRYVDLWFDQAAAPRPETTILADRAWFTAEQYDLQGRIETEKALAQLHASDEFRKWLVRNHRNVRLERD